MKHNTIILLHNAWKLTRPEYMKFTAGDSIYGNDSNPEELKRWPITEKAEALEELKKYRCTYRKSGQLYHVEEYALEYCETDDEGEFVVGSDFDMAEEDQDNDSIDR